MLVSKSAVESCIVYMNPDLALMDVPEWLDRVNHCLDFGNDAGLVRLYAQRKFYSALAIAIAIAEREAAEYEAPENGDWESDYDTY